MPFRALFDGEIVTPEEVDDKQPVECPECRGVLYPRDGNNLARHFVHSVDEDAVSCSTATGGESDTHARCVALAVASLTEQYPDAANVGAEVSIGVDGTATTPETRRADALVEFREENPFFGQGLIIEVQHKHHSKDFEGTTHDYLSAGYSVAWLTPDDFGQELLDYQVIDNAFRSDGGRAYSVRNHDPKEFDTRVEANFDWEPPSTKCIRYDETGSHNWRRIPSYAHPDGYEYEFCRCGARRRYDQTLSRFVYDHQGVLAPDVRIEKLRDAIVLHRIVGGRDLEEWLVDKQGSRPKTFERVFVNRVEVAPCRGSIGVHEWNRKEVIKKGVNDRPDVELWECRHCPVHLLVNHTRRGETKSTIIFGKKPKPEWGLDHLNGNPRNCRHRSHNKKADWKYCPICFQSNP